MINVASGHTLNIYVKKGSTGKLVAKGGDNNAGIGSIENVYAGNINIHGGTIEATGGQYGAGIGGGNHRGFDVAASQGGLTIYAGNVTATGGEYGAGIGSGDRGKCENIYIGGNSTVVKATAYGYGYAIGTGASRDGNFNIVITGGDITANGSENGAGIGSGDGGSFDGTIEISGGTIHAYSGKDATTEEVLGHGAGIGGGLSLQREMHGKIIISGGTITAESRGGAGIGGGEGGILAEDCSIEITGGTIDAKSKEGGAIGAGYHFLTESDGETHGLIYRAYCYGKINISGNPSINLYTSNERYHYTPIEIHTRQGR